MGYVKSAAGRWTKWSSELISDQSEIWLHYRAAVALAPQVEYAARRALAACGLLLGREYQAEVPSNRVKRSVAFDVKPPRMNVGPRDYRANFFESGAKQHRIEARGVRLKKRRFKRYTKIVGFQKGIRYLAIPSGGGVVFRSTAKHPGMSAGHYLKRTGEGNVGRVEEIVARAFQDAFR